MSPTICTDRHAQSSCLGGDPHSHWCDGCGHYVTGPDCERCADRETRSSLGLVAGIALAVAIVLLATVVCLAAHFTVGAR